MACQYRNSDIFLQHSNYHLQDTSKMRLGMMALNWAGSISLQYSSDNVIKMYNTSTLCMI